MKLLIVDDEKIIRRGMMNGYNWKKDGIDEVYEACNGLEAIEVLEKYKPEIIITDICMPKMNGIELAKYVYENYTGVYIIMLSGYAEFEYAQQAIKYNAGDYLLKPARIEDIAEVVKRIKTKIDVDRMMKQRSDSIEKSLEKNLPYIRNKYLNDLINGTAVGDNFVEGLIEDKCYGGYITAVLSVDNFEEIDGWNHDQDYRIVKYAVINILEELLAKSFSGVVFEDEFEHIVMIINLKQTDEKKNVIEFLEHCRECIEENIHLTVTIGIGRVCNKLEQVNMSYRDGTTALEHRFLSGKNKVIDIDDIRIISGGKLEYPRDIEKKLMECLDTSDIEGLDQRIDEFFMYFRNHGTVTVEIMKKICIDLVLALSRHLYHMGLEKEASEITESRLQDDKFMEKETLDEMREYIRKIFRTAAEDIQEKFSRNNKGVIVSALKYIESHLDEDISLKTVADNVHMSPNYFTSLFKQETGKKFSEYVSEKRIEKAKELLLNKDIKTYEAAEKVGYSDSRYFSQFFKRHTGMTPSEFRNKHTR